MLLVAIALGSPIGWLGAADKVACRNLRTAADCAREEAAKAHVQGVAVDKATDAQASSGVVRLEKVEALPAPEDVEAPQLNRWEKMSRAMGPGRSARPEWVESIDNSGVRTSCMNPCPTPLCCVKSGEFSLARPRTPGGL